MVKLFRKFTILLVMLAAPAILMAQTGDVGAIGTVGLSKKIGESVSVGVGQELRFNQNLSNFDRALTSFEADYSLIRKLLKAELGYDFIYQHKTDYNEFRQRASIGLSAQKKYYSFNFKFRTKAQSTWRDEARGDYKFNPKYVWRNKLECTYTIFGSSIKPFASAEVFCPLNGANGFYLNGYRAVLGAKYRTSSRTTLEFQIRYDQDVQVVNPQHIIYGGLGWNYNL